MEPSAHLRGDLQVTRSTFAGRDAEYLIRAGDKYFAVDARTAEIVIAIQESEDEQSCVADVSALLGREVSDLARFIEEHFPLSWRTRDQDLAGKATPFLLRFTILSERLTYRLSELLRYLFGWHGLFLAAVAAVVAASIAYSVLTLDQTDNSPNHPLLVIGLAIFGVLVHELGHASALAHAGGRSNGVGFGIYWGFPTFYADVTECWRLSRRAKLLVNIGGVYFQLLYMAIVAGMLLHLERPIDALNFLTITSLLIAHTLNPALKFDGYWFLNDMLGKTNLHRDIKNIFLGAGGTPGFSKPTTPQWVLLGSYLGCAALQITYMCWSAGHGIKDTAAGLSTTLSFPALGGSIVLLVVYIAILAIVAYKLVVTLLKTFAERSHAILRASHP